MTPTAKILLRGIINPALAPAELEGPAPLLLLGTAAANSAFSHTIALKSLRTPMEITPSTPLSIFGIRPCRTGLPPENLLAHPITAAQVCRGLYPSRLPNSLREWAHLWCERFPGMGTPEGFAAAYRRLVQGPEFL